MEGKKQRRTKLAIILLNVLALLLIGIDIWFMFRSSGTYFGLGVVAPFLSLAWLLVLITYHLEKQLDQRDRKTILLLWAGRVAVCLAWVVSFCLVMSRME